MSQRELVENTLSALRSSPSRTALAFSGQRITQASLATGAAQ